MSSVEEVISQYAPSNEAFRAFTRFMIWAPVPLLLKPQPDFIDTLVEAIPISKLVDLSGKTAIVTGAAHGIGAGIAYRLGEAGANVILGDIHADLPQTTERLQKKGFKVKSVILDVTKADQVQAAVDFAVKTFGGLDILVNNAGIFPAASLLDMNEDFFNKLVSVNLTGVFLCTKAAAKQMIHQGKGGAIVNVTSIDAVHPSMTGLAAYDATKHGVWGFTKNIALELASHKIKVNALAPGGIYTEGVRGSSSLPVDVIKGFASMIPLGRWGVPDDMARTALFLASDLSSYCTGTQVVCDGGRLLK